jgi:hypothetical protein
MDDLDQSRENFTHLLWTLRWNENLTHSVLLQFMDMFSTMKALY